MSLRQSVRQAATHYDPCSVLSLVFGVELLGKSKLVQVVTRVHGGEIGAVSQAQQLVHVHIDRPIGLSNGTSRRVFGETKNLSEPFIAILTTL